MCKCREALSLAVLIGRKLDHKILIAIKSKIWLHLVLAFEILKDLQFFIQFSGCMKEHCIEYAPLAQLVEHLTLNQGVPGSSP